MAILKTKKNETIPNAFNIVNQKPINLLIDAELHTQFKLKTTREGVSMTQIITRFIIEYLEEK